MVLPEIFLFQRMKFSFSAGERSQANSPMRLSYPEQESAPFKTKNTPMPPLHEWASFLVQNPSSLQSRGRLVNYPQTHEGARLPSKRVAEYDWLEATYSPPVHRRALGPGPISRSSVFQMPGFDTVGCEMNLVVCNWHFGTQSKAEMLKPDYCK